MKTHLNTSDQVRAILIDGPATAHEVGAALGLSKHHAHAWLNALRTMGHAAYHYDPVSGSKKVTGADPQHKLTVYEITRHGIAHARGMGLVPKVISRDPFNLYSPRPLTQSRECDTIKCNEEPMGRQAQRRRATAVGSAAVQMRPDDKAPRDSQIP